MIYKLSLKSNDAGHNDLLYLYKEGQGHLTANYKESNYKLKKGSNLITVIGRIKWN